MNNQYMNLDHVPALQHPGYPICGTCAVEVEFDNGWICPSCGTFWNASSLEYDEGDGERFEDWSDETRTGPISPKEHAWRWATLPPDVRDRKIQEWKEQD